MRLAHPIFRVARMMLTLAALCGAGAQGIAAVESPPPPKGEAATPKIPLPPEIEAKLKAFLDKAKVEKGKVLDARMKKEIDDVAGVTGLGDEGRQALEPAAKQAVEASVDDWSAKFNDLIRKIFIQQPAQASMMLDQELANVTAIAAQGDWYLNVIQPFEQEGWIKALHQTLTPAQAAAWDKTQAARKEDLEKETGDTLKSGVAGIHEQQTREILSECKEIELAAGLPPERADKLEALAKTVVDQTTEMWRKRAERMLLSMDDDQRRQFTRTVNGNMIFSIGQDENESPSRQTAWKEGVAGLLTAGEATRLQAARDARKSKRVHAMGGILLMLLDEKIAFTAKQRLQLQPMADRLVKDAPELFPDNDGVNTFGQYQYNPAMFFAAAGKATEAELNPILDDIQRKHWRHLSEPEGAAADTPDDGKSEPGENGEPEDVEKVISNFFYEKTENERKLLLAENILKAEDAARAAGLNAETTARLQLAARGAAEESLAGWKWFIEQQVRSQLQDVTPQNVKQRLESFQQFFFQNFQQNNPVANRQEDVLEKTVQVELTAAQQESWRKETDAREAFRRQAIASLIMAEFDRKNRLTTDQWGKLEPIIEGALRDYGPEISRMFPSNPVPWYLGPWLLMPFSGVPEADLKAVLSKDQLDRWYGSPECVNANNIWQNVQQLHNQRINQGQAGRALPLRPIQTVPPK